MPSEKEVTREEAKELVGDAEFGFLVLGESEHIPVIGSVEDTDELKKSMSVNHYRFGDVEAAEQ